MTDLVQYIVSSIVTNPDAVKVESHNENGNIVISLEVDQNDMGLVIGKSGQTIKAIRKLLTVRAMAENVRVNLQLIDNNPRIESENNTEDVKEETSEADASPETENA